MMRVILVLLECPILQNPSYTDPQYVDQTIGSICANISSLTSEQKAILVNTFAGYSALNLRAVVMMIQQFISVSCIGIGIGT